MFSFFRFSFAGLGNLEGEEEGKFDGEPVAHYAHAIVMDLFAFGGEGVVEAIVAHNVWMYAVHELYEALRACKRDDQTSLDDALAALDIAYALWVGSDQVHGANEVGHMLYNLAEVAGRPFDQDRGEAVVNARFTDALNNLQKRALEGSCTSEAGYVEFRTMVRKTIGIMTIPLVQMLIHHMMRDKSASRAHAVGLYSLSVAPRVEVCDPSAYKDIVQLMALNEFDSSTRSQAISAVQKSYSCLQVSCSDIGSYRDGQVPDCQDQNDPPNMVGYQATSAGVPVSSMWNVDGNDARPLTFVQSTRILIETSSRLKS